MGGTLHPLIIPSDQTNGTGTFNPSVYNDNGKLVVNIRHCQVTIYHSEKGIYEHEWGPLSYMNPENDVTLTTTNFFCTLNPKLGIDKIAKVNMDAMNKPTEWNFIGLEDSRVVRWDDKLYLIGVRRDTTPTGIGRMELSVIQQTKDGTQEMSRTRMPAPGKDDSYCEKNWMPIIDMPYHFVKWCNPTEVVKYDPVDKTTTTVFLGPKIEREYDIRGGSQVVKIGKHYVAIGHESRLFRSEADKKNATYKHLFMVWDENWQLVKLGDIFSFLNCEIEFCCGMAVFGDNLIISFGVQDNAAYLLSIPMKAAKELIYG
jgi:hypothetical protein